VSKDADRVEGGGGEEEKRDRRKKLTGVMRSLSMNGLWTSGVLGMGRAGS
jgi:hypothetical protein